MGPHAPPIERTATSPRSRDAFTTTPAPSTCARQDVAVRIAGAFWKPTCTAQAALMRSRSNSPTARSVSHGHPAAPRLSASSSQRSIALELIRRCVQGLLESTAYPNKEIVLVDSGSTDRETLAYYEHLTAENLARVVPRGRPFNYSAACNVGSERG